MDYKNEIIENVLIGLVGKLDQELLDYVSDKLSMELAKYDVEKTCTEMTVYDGGHAEILKRFIICKQIEGASESTLKRYYDINLAMLDYINKPIREITTNDLRIYLAYKRHTGKVCNCTLDGMRLCYSSFFSWLAAEGIIDRNPTLALKQIKYKKQLKKAFTAVELEKLREACTNQRDLALIDFLYATGVRVTECSNLNRQDVDFETSEIIVLGKGNKERRVYLSEVASMHLKEYLLSRGDENVALFAGKGGKRLGKNGIESLLKKIGKRAGVENVHPHRFRRTLATSLLNKGMDIVSVATLLGHADLRTTQIYCSINQDNVKYNYQKLIAA